MYASSSGHRPTARFLPQLRLQFVDFPSIPNGPPPPSIICTRRLSVPPCITYFLHNSSLTMSTLGNSFDHQSQSTAVIVPSKPQALTVSYPQLSSRIVAFQKKLAELGIEPQSAVSIALPNSFEFIVAFLATSWQVRPTQPFSVLSAASH